MEHTDVLISFDFLGLLQAVKRFVENATFVCLRRFLESLVLQHLVIKGLMLIEDISISVKCCLRAYYIFLMRNE